MKNSSVHIFMGCHMRVQVVVSLPCSKRFLSGYFGFPSSKKRNYQILIRYGTHTCKQVLKNF